MEPITLKVKKLRENAILPVMATDGSAGLDLYATDVIFNELGGRDGHRDYQYIAYTGIAVEIPKGYVGFLFPRSSVAGTCLRLANGVGVIDSDYRGELIAIFDVRKHSDGPCYTGGSKCAQLVIVPLPSVSLEEVQELSDTERGEGGFGSTGS